MKSIFIPAWLCIGIKVAIAIFYNNIGVLGIGNNLHREFLVTIHPLPFAAYDGGVVNPLNYQVGDFVGSGHIHADIPIIGHETHFTEKPELSGKPSPVPPKPAFAFNHACLVGLPGNMNSFRSRRRCHHNDRKIHYRQ